MKKIPISPEIRFWIKVKQEGACWVWTAAVRDEKTGYGLFMPVAGKSLYAHRYSYELVKGEIPEGLTIDHLCRNRLCVNPNHLEAVTLEENLRRIPNNKSTHCPKGHEYTPENSRFGSKLERTCRECGKVRCKQWRQNRKLSNVNI